jgi:hypothetical protein
MKTRWGEILDENNILTEYPRPQMERDSYLNLNGLWEYAVTETESIPDKFNGNILVPFSPECELSGVVRSKPLSPTETLWYRRTIELPRNFNVGRVILHFGAVDQVATVYMNGTEVCSHVGGYTPFSVDITEHLMESNIIMVKVRDFTDTSYHSRGKQKSERGGMWYTAQSGIWQTVWMESVPKEYISSLLITPLFDENAVELTVVSESYQLCYAKVGEISISFLSNESAKLSMKQFIPWTPECPHLYDLEVTMGEDHVKGYFGMRKFSVDLDDNGVKRLFLNNKPYFHNGLLDQGYYSDGMYTAPSDEAMIFDIEAAKKMGFNMLRKHIKIEPLRWYYHCDRMGMLVWQDMINGGGDYSRIIVTYPLMTCINLKDSHYRWFARENEDGRRQYYKELEEMINHLYNVVSIAMWVPFNEGWGQFDAEEAVKRIKKIDATRTIDHASGWHDQEIGNIKSLHVYFRKYRFKKDRLGRAVVLSEFGGYNCRINGHCFNENDYGYKKFDTTEELLEAYKKLYEGEILPAKVKGLSAAVYTQLTDVEDELNGLITYDREIIKMDVEKLREINEKVIYK